MSKKDTRYSMFFPKTKNSLLIDYPELMKIPQLQKLNKYDILFTWYYACKASPLNYEEDLSVKAGTAFDLVYGPNGTPGYRAKYCSGNFEEKIRNAIVVMQKFEIGPRIRAKMMTEKILDNYEQIVDIDPKKDFLDDEGNIDWGKSKSYVDACAKISSVLPTLINQSEGSFGVSEIEEGETISEINSETLIDEFHSQDN